ncbi:MAG: NAD(P)(+) transhydrogenase (Re/Si-specific) subunit beta, partial [Alphaproteobacteria bacterium]|nr:NAD(P)(+) transhydrogenase (Re/Si-specific) subunit beta [Alphaproteobacteria bacterium]
MCANSEAFLYLVASICFIMSLQGLSSAKTAKRGNLYGMVGMVVAIGTALLGSGINSYGYIVGGIVIGGAIGTFIARGIQMTSLPQLVAAFHSLVGLAAVFVAYAAYQAPEAYKIGTIGSIYRSSLIEMVLGTIIGAITFTGSIVAFGKLQGLIKGKPLSFAGQHL